MKIFYLAAVNLILLPSMLNAGEITIHKKDATVWSQDVIIQGSVTAALSQEGILYLDDTAIPFTISAADSFAVPIHLEDGTHTIYAEVDNGGTPVVSEAITLTLGYKVRPELYLYATVEGRMVNLHCRVIDNPDSSNLSFEWNEDPGNPMSLGLASINDTLNTAAIPTTAPSGEYYFNIFATEPDGDQVRARTFVTVTDTTIVPFNIKTDYAAWIDSAIIYEISPFSFVRDGTFKDIQYKLPELVELGINTIWIQPVMGTLPGSMGYEVLDYFEVRSDYGTKEDLHDLVDAAHNLGLKVLFDTVLNHTYYLHRYVLDAIEYGTDSHYYDFYQREFVDAPYSQNYRINEHGIYWYFWDRLLNLNFDHPEVERWMLEAARYWIEEYDADGYRFDAIWGVNARKPEFTKELRLTLKRYKPEVFMLAEDKAPWDMVFEERFDAAFDWWDPESWISRWSWVDVFGEQYCSTQSERAHAAITNDDQGYHPRAKILRFIENNDTDHFITHFSLEETRMAATLMYAIPGIPMLYNGQETGATGHPWYIDETFKRDQSIQSLDQYGLFPFYQRLNQLRREIQAFSSDNFEEVNVSSKDCVWGFRRWAGDEHILCVANFGNMPQAARLESFYHAIGADSAKTYYFTNLFTGQTYSGSPSTLYSVVAPEFSTSLLLFSDTAVVVTPLEVGPLATLPQHITLEQNHPNPFNPTTTIDYTLNRAAFAELTVFDLKGRKVSTLVSEYQGTGEYSVRFSGADLPSGVYVYRLQTGEKSISQKMVLLK